MSVLFRVRRIAFAVVVFLLIAAPALAQTPAATPTSAEIPKASPPWTYYMAILTIGVAALTVILAVLGYLVQAPGFRRGSRRATGPGQAAS